MNGSRNGLCNKARAIGRDVVHVEFGGSKTFLLRAIVNDGVEPAVVITAYRTSKIEKYWRQP